MRRCRIGSASSQRIRPPAVVVLGAVAGLPRDWAWFEQRPLFGQSVLVTRPAQQAADLGDLLEDAGAEVLLQPAIEIREPADWAPVDAALSRLEQFDWLVFSSVNGVNAVLRRLRVDWSRLAGPWIPSFGGYRTCDRCTA